MGLKDTLQWARNEWALLARRDQMTPAEAVRWLSQWVPFGARTIGYATASLTLGPLTADRRASLWAMKAWSRSCLRALGIDARLTGEVRAPGSGLLYASNHQSLLDILVLGALLPGDLKWAAKRSLMNIPFLGWHLRLSGHVPVDRRSGSRAAAETIHRIVDVLGDGKQLLVFPEGTRSTTGQVQEFKNGAFYAAVRGNAPVVPVALEGTHRLMGKHAADSGDVSAPRRVLVQMGEPLHPRAEGSERDRVVDLRDRCHASVVAMHDALCRTLGG
jgi:1-acyl-sn-glycerol-3-phosphate acyltransferase